MVSERRGWDDPSVKALVLDFGGPVVRTAFELLEHGEDRAGLPRGTFAWTGPFDPASDPDWQALLAGQLTEREYWQRRADEFAALTGQPATYHALFAGIFDADEADLVRPGAIELIASARARGLAVAILTNDMRAFQDQQWIDRMSVLKTVDVIVDGSIEGVLKPDPAIYRLLTDRLGVDAADCLFLDDQPGNIDGAIRAGMSAIWFDVTEPEQSFAAAARAISTGAPLPAEHLPSAP